MVTERKDCRRNSLKKPRLLLTLVRLEDEPSTGSLERLRRKAPQRVRIVLDLRRREWRCHDASRERLEVGVALKSEVAAAQRVSIGLDQIMPRSLPFPGCALPYVERHIRHIGKFLRETRLRFQRLRQWLRLIGGAVSCGNCLSLLGSP